MGVRFIAGRAGSGKTAHCLSAVARHLRESHVAGPRLVLLVPEQAALQIERALIERESFRTLGRCEVLSFRRLARRVLDDAAGPALRVLSPLGRQMVLRRQIGRLRGRLRCFGASADRPGFIAALSETVSELIQHGATPADLERSAEGRDANDPSGLLLRETAAIYEAYLEFLGEAEMDAEGLLEAARKRLDSATWLHGALFWLDGFAGYSPLQVRFLASLARLAASMDIALLVDPDAECVTRPDVPPDAFSLFARTERTWVELTRALHAAGVAIQPPLRLKPDPLPRFAASPALGTLEKTFFHVAPRQAEFSPFTAHDVTADPKAAQPAIRLVEAPDLRAEVRAAVREVHRLTVGGAASLRFRDVAIVCRSLEPYHDLLSSDLKAHGIPFFIDRRRTTTHHPLVELLRAAVRLFDAHRFAEAMIVLLKTGLTPLSPDDADALENVLLARGVTHPKAWSDDRWLSAPAAGEPWAADWPAAQTARTCLLYALGDWWPSEGPPPRRACRVWAESLAALLERLGTSRRLAEWTEAARQRGDLDETQEHLRVWTDAVSLLEEMAAVLGDEPMSPPELADVLDAGLSQFTLGLVPPTLDQVLVGSIDRSRHPAIRAMFLLGFSEGHFPSRPAEDPILGDPERELLSTTGTPIGPTQTTRLLDERLLAYVAVTRASELLWISYTAADGDGRPMSPSPYWGLLCGAAPEAVVERIDSTDAGADALGAATPRDVAGVIVHGIRGAADSGNELQTIVPPARTAALYEAAVRDPRVRPELARAVRALAAPQGAQLSSADVAALFPRGPRTSVSRLECMARCAFQHFGQYALRLQPRAVHELGALDLGRLSHAILEHFFNELIDNNRTLRDLTPRQIAASLERVRRHILPRFAAEMSLEEPAADAVDRQTARDLSVALDAQHHWSSAGRPTATEVVFGSRSDETAADADATPAADAWPALTLTTPAGRTVELHGKIDRIDVIREGGRALGVVYDYKRGRDVRLRLDHVFYGLSLQTLAYLLVLREHGDRLKVGSITPTAAFLAPLLGGFRSVDHPSDADGEDFDPYRVFNPRGVIDFDWIDRLDPDLAPGQRSRTYAVYRKQDDTIGYFDASDALSGDEFAALLDFVRHRMGELADRWLDGDVRVRPRAVAGQLPCGRCDYAAVCRFEAGVTDVDFLRPLTRSDVAERLRTAQR
ncbi:MAG: PD-(D/E)XK nuclease family protein [Phycisphaerae bacterium]|nr:PD-(D/E)XK nuclease family protein [Phycisphaerae bacterium]